MSIGEDPMPGRPSTSTDDDHVERANAVIHGNALCEGIPSHSAQYTHLTGHNMQP